MLTTYGHSWPLGYFTPIPGSCTLRTPPHEHSIIRVFPLYKDNSWSLMIWNPKDTRPCDPAISSLLTTPSVVTMLTDKSLIQGGRDRTQPPLTQAQPASQLQPDERFLANTTRSARYTDSCRCSAHLSPSRDLASQRHIPDPTDRSEGVRIDENIDLFLSPR